MSTFLLVVQLLGSAISTYLFFSLCMSLKRNAKLARLVKRTRPLSKKVRVGEYVKFTGTITYPNTKTKFRNIPSCCWQSTVWAVFKSKAKAPSKGYVTHTPKIYSESSDSEPLIISGNNLTVIALFDKVFSVVINPRKKEFKSKQPPSQEVKDLVKAKYKSYKIVETWFPPRAKVVILGTVLGYNDASVTISGDKNKDFPPMMFEGSISGLKRIFTKKILASFSLLLVSILQIFVYWLVFPSIADVIAALTAIGFIITTLFLRKLFRV